MSAQRWRVAWATSRGWAGRRGHGVVLLSDLRQVRWPGQAACPADCGAGGGCGARWRQIVASWSYPSPRSAAARTAACADDDGPGLGSGSAGLIPLSAVAAEGAVLASAAARPPNQDTRAELELTPTAAGLLAGNALPR